MLCPSLSEAHGFCDGQTETFLQSFSAAGASKKCFYLIKTEHLHFLCFCFIPGISQVLGTK